jgi:hypothetical protein
MIAMQYQITLPTTYDMGIIRTRVARFGHLLDDYPGLGQKAFLIREKGVDGSPVNQYAPFYLWADASAAASFLWAGGGFGGIVRDFGRPVVQTWIGGTYHRGPEHAGAPAYAVKTTESIADDLDPVDAAARTGRQLAARADEVGLHSVAYAIDPRTWQLVTLSLHAGRPETDVGEIYQVLHLAAPDSQHLPAEVRERLA